MYGEFIQIGVEANVQIYIDLIHVWDNNRA